MLRRDLGRLSYTQVFGEMRAFTAARDEHTPDELWLLEHDAVFTLGQAGKPEHVLDAGDIPLVRSNRGGQVTWHGPGQLVAYTLFDLSRAKVGVRDFVSLLEQSIIDMLARALPGGPAAMRRAGAPGIYVDGAKLAALGLRVQRGRAYHGLSINVDADLSAFARINPCGFEGLEVTSLRRLGVSWTVAETADALACALGTCLGVAVEPAG